MVILVFILLLGRFSWPKKLECAMNTHDLAKKDVSKTRSIIMLVAILVFFVSVRISDPG